MAEGPGAPRAAVGETGAGLSVRAPAKINLYLHVTGKRDDGFHLLDSLVAFAGLHDLVGLRHADEFSLKVEGPYADAVPTGPENLVLKAAEKLGRAAGISKGCAITLKKNLAVASGIGGGSADAAAVLRGLVALWEIDLDAPDALDLGTLALEIGADVPVCLFGRSAFMGGIGEDIIRAPALPPVWLVLVNPNVPSSTPAVFKERKGDFSQAARFDAAPASAEELAGILKVRGNDLWEAAARLAPVIGDVLESLNSADECLLARMSGSGATCFGLFDDAGGAARAAVEIGRGHPDWWVRATPLLDDTQTA